MTRTNTIYFSSGEPSVEVLRLSKDGIWANPDIPADEAAKFVLNAIGHNIEVLVQAAIKAEREACSELCIELAPSTKTMKAYKVLHEASKAILARGQA